jgi:hypothetical protein
MVSRLPSVQVARFQLDAIDGLGAVARVAFWLETENDAGRRLRVQLSVFRLTRLKSGDL